MEVRAVLRNLRMAPRKVRLVADLVRGKDVAWAVGMLGFQRRKAGRPVRKLLQSAVANAGHNFRLERNRLFVKAISVDGGPTIKRSTPRAHGRATPIRKRTSHITVVLDERVTPSKSPARFKKK